MKKNLRDTHQYGTGICFRPFGKEHFEDSSEKLTICV